MLHSVLFITTSCCTCTLYVRLFIMTKLALTASEVIVYPSPIKSHSSKDCVMVIDITRRWSPIHNSLQYPLTSGVRADVRPTTVTMTTTYLCTRLVCADHIVINLYADIAIPIITFFHGDGRHVCLLENRVGTPKISDPSPAWKIAKFTLNHLKLSKLTWVAWLAEW